MLKRINYLTVMVVIYAIATLFYVFVHKNEGFWSLYRDGVTTFLVLTLFYGCVKKEKTEVDKSLLIALVLLKIFNLITYLIWYTLGSDWQSTPTFFCVMVVASVLFGLSINKKALWK